MPKLNILDQHSFVSCDIKRASVWASGAELHVVIPPLPQEVRTGALLESGTARHWQGLAPALWHICTWDGFFSLLWVLLNFPVFFCFFLKYFCFSVSWERAGEKSERKGAFCIHQFKCTVTRVKLNFKRGFSRQKHLIYTEGAAEQIHFLAQQVFNYFLSIN